MTVTSEQIQTLKEQAECICGILENIAGYEPGDIDGDDVELRFETEDGFDTGCNVSIVEQCQSAADVIRSLLTERDADKALIEEQAKRIAELDKYAEAEASGADKVAENAVYWMKRCKELESALNLASASYAGERERADALQARTLTVKFPEAATEGGQGYRKKAIWVLQEACFDAGITLVVGE